MFNIHILTLGTFKEDYWKQAEAEYVKRLGPYSKLKITELKEISFNDKDKADVIKLKEAQKILPYLEKSTVSIALHEHAKTYNSIEFANKLETLSAHGEEILFIFGGPKGLHSSVLEQVNMTLSLSPLTFPHQLARVVLMEQIYRAATITSGKRYHY